MEKELEQKYACRQCGQCCYQDIPLTLYDIHRIAGYLDKKDQDIFKGCVAPDHVSRVSGVFVMRKKKNGSCIYLGEDNRCTVYEARPRVCSFFPCRELSKVDREAWRELYLKSAPYEIFWEHAISTNLTHHYIASAGLEWNEAEYFRALSGIQNCVITDMRQKLAVAKAPDGRPLAMLYNCKTCKRHVCRENTEITLLDIKRIAGHLGCSFSKAYQKAVDVKPHPLFGGLQILKTNRLCIFKTENGECAIYEARPMSCAFSPCHMKDIDRDSWLRFFFAAGEKNEQWQHFIAARATREYVAAHGTSYKKTAVDNTLGIIERNIGNRKEKEEFMNDLDRFRYDVQPITPL